jgi:cytochrome c oxidase subunit II
VGKWWSILFGVVMLACLGLFIAAPFMNMWLPEGVSTHSADVDRLFYIILAITGFFFVLTEALLVIFLFKYAGRPKGTPLPLSGPNFFQKNMPFLSNPHRIEMAWTVVPAAILLYIAFAQVGTWLEIKDRSRAPTLSDNTPPVQIHVSARQFEWRVRYPSSNRLEQWLAKKDPKDFESFGIFETTSAPRYPHLDDVHVVNEVHIWKGQTILIQLNTLDVIHSFNVPHMRVKQDALPGKTIPLWFTPTASNTRYDEKTHRWVDRFNPGTGKMNDPQYRWEIACAELCGWGHHRMIGRVYVHETRKDFFDWLRHEEKESAPPSATRDVAAR